MISIILLTNFQNFPLYINRWLLLTLCILSYISKSDLLKFYSTTSSPEDPVTAVAAMPGCSMKIYAGDASNHVVAENVKIGDPLSLVVSIDHQDIYGIRVTDCVVKGYLVSHWQTVVVMIF